MPRKNCEETLLDTIEEIWDEVGFEAAESGEVTAEMVREIAIDRLAFREVA